MQLSLFSKYLLAGLLFFAGAQLQAQTTTPKPTPTQAEKRAKRAAKRDAAYAKQAERLGLSTEQQASFKSIDADYRTKIKAAGKEDPTAVSTLKAERRQAKRAILDKEQAAKYDAQYAKKQKKRAKRAKKKAAAAEQG